MFYRALIMSSAAVFAATVILDLALVFLAWFLIFVPAIMAWRLLHRKVPRDSREPTYEEYRRLPEEKREKCPRLCRKLKGSRGYSGGKRYCPFCKAYMKVASRDCPCCSAPLRTNTLNAAPED